MPRVPVLLLATALLGPGASFAVEENFVPACRLDSAFAGEVKKTLERASIAYRGLGKVLPFDQVRVNDLKPRAVSGILDVLLVVDAYQGSTTKTGCVSGSPKGNATRDRISVGGGCFVSAETPLQIRCSSSAIRIFAGGHAADERAHPALLYVLSHELAHIIQGRGGDYGERAVVLDLSRSRDEKLAKLRESCDPVATKAEAQADAMALQVLQRVIAERPYRDASLTERGAMYWNIDRLALATSQWVAHSEGAQFVAAPKLHSAFIPTEFPMPPNAAAGNAHAFVCDVLKQSKGKLAFPVWSGAHPPVDERLRRIAEALEPIADRLPSAGAAPATLAIAKAQEGVSPILTHIYRETGVYLREVSDAVCTVVNGEDPSKGCPD